MTASDSTAAQHEHQKQQCAQGCCIPSWMTTDTLGLGDGAPRIRQIREQRYEVGGGLCQPDPVRYVKNVTTAWFPPRQVTRSPVLTQLMV